MGDPIAAQVAALIDQARTLQAERGQLIGELATLREELRTQVLLSASQRIERAAVRADLTWALGQRANTTGFREGSPAGGGELKVLPGCPM